jgi:hypothetical protein
MGLLRMSFLLGAIFPDLHRVPFQQVMNGRRTVLMPRAILIHAAMIGYEQDPTFERFAPGQRSMTERIEWEIRHGSGQLRRAVEADGLLGDWVEDKAKL